MPPLAETPIGHFIPNCHALPISSGAFRERVLGARIRQVDQIWSRYIRSVFSMPIGGRQRFPWDNRVRSPSFHSSQGIISSMISRNSSRFVSFLRHPYSMSDNISCFISLYLPFSDSSIVLFSCLCGRGNDSYYSQIKMSFIHSR